MKTKEQRNEQKEKEKKFHAKKKKIKKNNIVDRLFDEPKNKMENTKHPLLEENALSSNQNSKWYNTKKLLWRIMPAFRWFPAYRKEVGSCENQEGGSINTNMFNSESSH